MLEKPVEKIAGICRKHGVSLLYLFGSQKDTALRVLLGEVAEIGDPLTDADVGAVMDSSGLTVGRRLDLYAALHNDLEDLFLPLRLDLVFLDETHSVFQSTAISGVMLPAKGFKMRMRTQYCEEPPTSSRSLTGTFKRFLRRCRGDRPQVSRGSSSFHCWLCSSA